MEAGNDLLTGQNPTPKARQTPTGSIPPRLLYALYALALAVSISIWFLAIHANLWLDETGSYWVISRGFAKIWREQYISLGFPAYFYVLWLCSKILGTTPVALRIPSVVAMLAAAALLYLGARELFKRDVAIIAVVVFSLHRLIIAESVEIRPYAFATLATTLAIYLLLRLRRSNSSALAALFGLSAALIVYFHYLFAAILPAFVICFFVLKKGNRKALWRQFTIALAVFTAAFLPLIPSLRYLFRTSASHVYEAAPKFSDLFWTLASGWLSVAFIGAVFLALLIAAARPKQAAAPRPFETEKLLICASLGLIPILILYGISAATSIHMFAGRHRVVAIPGIALCWAFLVSRLRPSIVRLAFCVALVAMTAFECYRAPAFRQPGDSWKGALALAEKEASTDNAPVLVCSHFVESNYVPMPLYAAKQSRYFAQLSYYKLTVPVVPLPQSLNSQAMQIGSQFLQHAAQNHERFFALGDPPSYQTLDWLAQHASQNYSVRDLGILGQTRVLEFTPRPASSS